MITPEAIHSFADRQKRLLRQTYDAAWQEGVQGYEPDADPEEEPEQPRSHALAGLAGAALLAARRLYRYEPPAAPDPVRRAVALAPAYASVNAMRAELATLSPLGAIAAGAQGEVASATERFASALEDWAGANAWRLDAGVSTAWAGEQNGYGEAADADGQLLGWVDEGDSAVCVDCQALADMPPQPLSEWPSQPGDGSTACNVGCFAPGTTIEGRVEGALRVFYEGPMVEIETAMGRRLTLTANHPVATTQGFIPAGSLRNGQYVLGHRGQLEDAIKGTPFPEAQSQQHPSLVEDVFESWASRYASVHVRATGIDLYGDARFLQGDVHVVMADGSLLNDSPSRAAEKVRQGIFMAPPSGTSLLAGSRRLQEFNLRLGTACRTRPRSRHLGFDASVGLDSPPDHLARISSASPIPTCTGKQSPRGPIAPSVRVTQRLDRVSVVVGSDQSAQCRCGRRGRLTCGIPCSRALASSGLGVGSLGSRPLDVARFGSVADIDVALSKPATQDTAAESRFVAEVLERFSSLIALDQVVQVRHYHFAGHVYDLQSPLGWISANGILAANCRCSLDAIDIAILPGDTYAPQLDQAQEDLVGRLLTAQSEALASAMPDMYYLQ